MKRLKIGQIANLQTASFIWQFEQSLQDFGYRSPSIKMLIRNTYSFATINDMTIQQKQSLLNFVIQLIYEIPKLQTVKSQFLQKYSSKFSQLSKRSGNQLSSKFTYNEIIKIKQYFQRQVLPYYDLYQFVLDSNPEFNFIAQQFNPVPFEIQPAILQGQVVQPETVEVLKAFVGQRQPKQQKKDPKKK